MEIFYLMWLNTWNWNSIHYLKNLEDLIFTDLICVLWPQVLEAQYNNNIQVTRTLDKPENTAPESWESNSDPKGTHWPKMISCGGTFTVKCQPRKSKRPKWGYSERLSKVQDEEKATTFKRRVIIGKCSKDGVWPRPVQHLFVEVLSRQLERVKLVFSWKIKLALPKRWSSRYSLAKFQFLKKNPG